MGNVKSLLKKLAPIAKELDNDKYYSAKVEATVNSSGTELQYMAYTPKIGWVTGYSQSDCIAMVKREIKKRGLL